MYLVEVTYRGKLRTVVDASDGDKAIRKVRAKFEADEDMTCTDQREVIHVYTHSVQPPVSLPKPEGIW